MRMQETPKSIQPYIPACSFGVVGTTVAERLYMGMADMPSHVLANNGSSSASMRPA